MASAAILPTNVFPVHRHELRPVGGRSLAGWAAAAGHGMPAAGDVYSDAQVRALGRAGVSDPDAVVPAPLSPARRLLLFPPPRAALPLALLTGRGALRLRYMARCGTSAQYIINRWCDLFFYTTPRQGLVLR